jgi:hypothetical protein
VLRRAHEQILNLATHPSFYRSRTYGWLPVQFRLDQQAVGKLPRKCFVCRCAMFFFLIYSKRSK